MTAQKYDKSPSLRRFAWEWLVLVVFLSIFGGVLVWMWQVERTALEHRETERLRAQATVVERNAVRQLEAVNNALLGFAARFGGWRQHPDGMRQASNYLETTINAMPDVEALLYLDENGIGQASSDKSAGVVGRDFSQLPYFAPFKQRPQAEKLHIGEPLAAQGGHYLINVTRVIAGARGEFRGVVTAGLQRDHYRVLLNSVLYAPDMWVAIAHGGGVQFMMEPDRPGQSGLQLKRPGSLFEKHMQSRATETIHKAVTLSTGESRLIVIRTVQVPHLNMDAPLVLGVSRGLDEVFQPSEALRTNYMLISAVVAVTVAGGLLLSQQLRLNAARTSWDAQEEIREREDELNRFFSVNLDLFVVLDQNRRFKRVNGAWQRMLGHPGEQLIGRDVRELVHPDDLQKIETQCQSLISGQPVMGFIVRMRHLSGQFLEIEWRALYSERQLFLSGRDVTADQAAMREIEQLNVRLEAQTAQLQEMAFHDGLTGVFNRRHFDDSLSLEWRTCMRDAQPLSVLLLDIDHFKRYNDTYGHLQGDECLRQVALEFQARCKRPRDMVARYGGEEFVALLPDTDVDGAVRKAREVVEAVAALQMRHAGSPAAQVVTVSIGVAAMVPRADANPETLLRHADDALYSAKLLGRNRAVQYSEHASPPA